MKASREPSPAAGGAVRGKPFTIDCTPSWRTQAEWCIVGLSDGSDATKDVCRAEVRRMGDLLDKLIAERAS